MKGMTYTEIAEWLSDYYPSESSYFNADTHTLEEYLTQKELLDDLIGSLKRMEKENE